MSQGALIVCPKGHDSEDPDYCSECGIKLGGAPGTGSLPHGVPLRSKTICPGCGSSSENADCLTCDICGYDFQSGTHGNIPLLREQVCKASIAEERTGQEVPPAQGCGLAGPISASPINSGVFGPSGPEPSVVDEHIHARNPERPSDPLGGPELHTLDDNRVACQASLRFASEASLSVADIAVGLEVQLNGHCLQPMAEHVLKDGDEIMFGHAFVVRVQVS